MTVASSHPPESEPYGVHLLEAAYEEEFGKQGHDLAGHNVSYSDVTALLEKGRGSNMLYGELMPAGVSRLMRAFYSGRAAAATSGPLLELGMGTGKVALQFFLASSPPDRDVYGVELAPSRWELADAALQKVADAAPSRFRYEALGDGAARLCDLLAGRTCDIVQGSLLDTPEELLASASAVCMQVCLPREVQILASQLLQHCSAGCRVVCYAPLHGLAEDCRLMPVRPEAAARSGDDDPGQEPPLGDGKGGLSLLTSWNPKGHGFAFYEFAEDRAAAEAAWASVAAAYDGVSAAAVKSGNPSRFVALTEAVLGEPDPQATWAEGDRVLVGFSWLPFPDLGNPGDDEGGIGGVTWSAAIVTSVDCEGYVAVTYQTDGTVEEKVHPERLRREGCVEERAPLVMGSEEDTD